MPKKNLKKTITVKKKSEYGVILQRKSKLDLFLEEYEKNGGNGTEAALKVFDTKSRVNASNLAAQYLKRAQSIGRMHMEAKGITFDAMIERAWAKDAVSKTPEWWDRLAKIGGYEDFLSKGPVTKATVNIMQVQKDLLDEYVDGEYVEDEE